MSRQGRIAEGFTAVDATEEKLLLHRMALDDIHAGFDRLADGGALGRVVEF